MRFTTGAGVRWLDIVLIGFSVTLFPILVGVVLLIDPGAPFGPSEVPLALGVAAVGASVILVGLMVGKRTHWRIPDRKVAKIR